MQWYREVQFISAVPMPSEMEAEFRTTVNGMWASPRPTRQPTSPRGTAPADARSSRSR